jgi:tRNA-specific 2-thiouridylase
MKSEVREIAKSAKIPTAYRKDSQGICFLGKINYNDFIRRYLGEKEGKIVELETGKVLGKHKGFWFHTIGQRKGLGLSGGPWYVVKKDIEENVVYVSCGFDTQMQYGDKFLIRDMHFITRDVLGDCQESDITIKIRHTPEFTKAKITKEEGRYFIHSSEMLQGIAPGQFCVIYDKDSHLCLGSGEITL